MLNEIAVRRDGSGLEDAVFVGTHAGQHNAICFNGAIGGRSCPAGCEGRV